MTTFIIFALLAVPFLRLWLRPETAEGWVLLAVFALFVGAFAAVVETVLDGSGSYSSHVGDDAAFEDAHADRGRSR